MKSAVVPASLAPHPAPQIAEVVFNLPLERSFHYLIPPSVQTAVQPGVRVRVPFGPRERLGYVVRLVSESSIRELKSIRRVIDPIPVIADERWALASWLSSYYDCSLGEALSVIVPAALRLREPAHGMTPRSHETSPPDTGTVTPVQRHALTLTPHQRRGLEAIVSALEQGSATGQRKSRRTADPQTILLHGVTGSGKTELYLQAIDHALKQNRSVICLVPEIALTPQTIDRFRERFGDQVAVWHSRLTARQRGREWQRLSCGASRIVVGARSAIFAPVQQLGLIILDEEHEQTYKQEDSPRYHAREVALARARFSGAVVILGSATPSIESYYAATHGRGGLISLPERVEGRALPSVEIVDLREELANHHRATWISSRLQRALEQTLTRGEQVMLLLNRRGFARVAQCHTCGGVVRCPRCAVPLVYHAARQELVCHYCNAHHAPGESCPMCHKGYLRFRGAGTERIESELHRLFPASSIARMDRDTTKRRESHRAIYDAVKSRAIGLLVGTQMIAKGLDFPQVTLVGIISADTALNLPDFRAGERTFDLLTQMAGRAGRGHQPGRVLIQTYCPTHYAIQAAQRHDYRQFYEEELRMRRRVKLPPFVHLIELTLLGSSRQRVTTAADALAAQLRRAAARQRLPAAPKGLGKSSAAQAGITLLGPAPHRVPRLRRAYRMCLLLKGRRVEPMMALLRETLQPGRRFHGLPVIVDVDPL